MWRLVRGTGSIELGLVHSSALCRAVLLALGLLSFKRGPFGNRGLRESPRSAKWAGALNRETSMMSAPELRERFC